MNSLTVKNKTILIVIEIIIDLYIPLFLEMFIYARFPSTLNIFLINLFSFFAFMLSFSLIASIIAILFTL